MAKEVNDNKAEKAPELNIYSAMQHLDAICMNLEKGLTHLDYAVHYALLRYCNRLGWKKVFYAKGTAIAMMSGLSIDSLTKSLKRLDEVGIIKYSPGIGRNKASTYRILFDKKPGSVELIDDKSPLSAELLNEKSPPIAELSEIKGGDLTPPIADLLNVKGGDITPLTADTNKKNTLNTSNTNTLYKENSERESIDNEIFEIGKNAWYEMYRERFKTNGAIILTPQKDIPALERIYQYLKLRMEAKGQYPWTKESAKEAFSKFFIKADKARIQWLQDNFELHTVDLKKQMILDSKKGDSFFSDVDPSKNWGVRKIINGIPSNINYSEPI